MLNFKRHASYFEYCSESKKSLIFLENVYAFKSLRYSVNKPLQAAGMSADNVRGRKMNIEGKCEIFRTISQPRTLSADIPASQKGVYLFYNPPINFHFAINRS